MKKVLLYDPSISTLNIGDEIICNSAKNELSSILDDAFVVNVSTHLPISYNYAKLLSNANFDYKFVLGTNLLMGNLFKRFKQWDINFSNASLLGPCILMGAGWWQYNNDPNFCTRKLYQKILSHDALHSVRDDYTACQLEKCGFKNVIVTSCPTMWGFTPEFLSRIKKTKSNNVCTTITDYCKDVNADKKMLSILTSNYNVVYLWLQGIGDFEYYNAIKNNIIMNEKIQLLSPTVDAWDRVLSIPDIDYVGTRLHAGIRALQHKKRTIIIAVDNRALEKKKSFNLTVVKRSEIDMLDDLINSEFSTLINLPLFEINKWKESLI